MENFDTDNKFTHYSLYKYIYLFISWFWYLLSNIVYNNAPQNNYFEKKYIYIYTERKTYVHTIRRLNCSPVKYFLVTMTIGVIVS